MQFSRSIPRQAISNIRSSVSTTGRSPSPNSSNLLSFNENEVSIAEHDISTSSCNFFLVVCSRHLIQFCCAVAGEVQDCSLPFCSMWASWSTARGSLFFIYFCLIFLFQPWILFYKYRWCDIWMLTLYALCRWKAFLLKWEHWKWIWC